MLSLLSLVLSTTLHAVALHLFMLELQGLLLVLMLLVYSSCCWSAAPRVPIALVLLLAVLITVVITLSYSLLSIELASNPTDS